MVRIEIETGNEAFSDMDGRYEIARILHEIAERIKDGYTVHSIMDINDNMVGTWEYNTSK